VCNGQRASGQAVACNRVSTYHTHRDRVPIAPEPLHGGVLSVTEGLNRDGRPGDRLDVQPRGAPHRRLSLSGARDVGAHGTSRGRHW